MDKFYRRITVKKVVLALSLLVVAMQFYRPNKNDSGYEPAQDFLVLTKAPQQVQTLFKTSCYDCHSNYTNYEWYDNIAPVSWWVDNNVAKGKVSINLSEWKTHDAQKRLSFLSASVWDIKIDRMPTPQYIKMHPEATLSDTDKKVITTWINGIDRFDPMYDINNH